MLFVDSAEIARRVRTVLGHRLQNKYIHTFGYRCFYRDGKSWSFSSNDDWNRVYDQYLANKNVSSYEKQLRCLHLSGQTVFFREGLPVPNDEFTAALYELDIWNTLTLYVPGEEKVEGFYFSSSRENDGIAQTYLTQMDFLKDTACLIKKEMPSLIKGIRKECVATVCPAVFSLRSNANQHLKKYYFKSRDSVFCVPLREAQCLFYRTQGKNIKDISVALRISPRTVEGYLGNLKKRVGEEYWKDFCHSVRQQSAYEALHGIKGPFGNDIGV